MERWFVWPLLATIASNNEWIKKSKNWPLLLSHSDSNMLCENAPKIIATTTTHSFTLIFYERELFVILFYFIVFTFIVWLFGWFYGFTSLWCCSFGVMCVCVYTSTFTSFSHILCTVRCAFELISALCCDCTGCGGFVLQLGCFAPIHVIFIQ